MSWKDNIRKAKFQGPPQKHAEFKASVYNLKVVIKNIDYSAQKLEKFLDENDVSRAKSMLELIREQIDKIDAEVLEQEKYVGTELYSTTKFGERIDTDSGSGSTGTKYVSVKDRFK